MKQTISPIITRKRAACLPLMTGTLLILLAGSSLLTPAQADDVYKWADESGEIQYTQMPPPHGITAIRIQSAPPRYADEETDDIPPPPAETTGDPLDDGFAGADQADADQDEGGNTPSRNAEIAQSMKENCNNARNNLTSLNRGNIRFVKPNGEVFRLNEEERQQRIEEANIQIKMFCNG